MSAHAFSQLCRILEEEARVLTELHKEMVLHRAAFISMRPSTTEGAVQHLEQLRGKSAQLEAQRVDASKALANELRMTGAPSLRELTQHAPSSLARRLERSGADVRKAARAIQVESRVGARLLDTSRNAQVGLMHDLAGLASKSKHTGYDRNASVVQGGPQSGSLINGSV